MADFTVLTRVLGYALNIGLLLFGLIFVPHHRAMFSAWIMWLGALMVGAFLRHLGYFDEYIWTIDYVSTPLLYLVGLGIAWTLLKYMWK